MHDDVAALPPSSSKTRFLPAIDLRYQPTLALPVNESVAKRSSRTSDSATATSHGSTWNAPGGAPASLTRSASLSAVSGAWGGGFRTIEQPLRERGRELVATRLSGKLNGAIAITGPAGTRV